MAFEEVKISELQFNPFDKISRQWMIYEEVCGQE